MPAKLAESDLVYLVYDRVNNKVVVTTERPREIEVDLSSRSIPTWSRPDGKYHPINCGWLVNVRTQSNCIGVFERSCDLQLLQEIINAAVEQCKQGVEEEVPLDPKAAFELYTESDVARANVLLG